MAELHYRSTERRQGASADLECPGNRKAAKGTAAPALGGVPGAMRTWMGLDTPPKKCAGFFRCSAPLLGLLAQQRGRWNTLNQFEF
jgi:hypothetical protein